LNLAKIIIYKMEELLEQRYQLLHKVSMLRSRIGSRKMPSIPQPPRPCTHWDFLLEEMKWLACDVIEGRRHKYAVAYVVANEIVNKNKHDDKDKVMEDLHDRVESQTTEDKQDSDIVINDARIKIEEKQPPPERKGWKIDKIVSNPLETSLTLVYTTIPNAPGREDEHYFDSLTDSTAQMAENLPVMHDFTYPPGHKKKDSSSPPTPDTLAHEADSVSSEHYLPNFQLFYDNEALTQTEQDFKTTLELQQIEDVEVYGPPREENAEFREVYHEQEKMDREMYELLPDPEEYTMREVVKKIPEELEPSLLIRFHSEQFPFPFGQGKREWKIFEDMYLEKFVWELGGNWDLIADLMNQHEMSSGEVFTSDDCCQRWVLLQKRKGRNVPQGFRPQAVLMSRLAPIQRIPSKFSLFQLKKEQPRGEIMEGIEYTTEGSSMLEFMVGNLYFESNSYFYHYKDFNSKYYADARDSEFNISDSWKNTCNLAEEFKVMNIEETDALEEFAPAKIAKDKNLKGKPRASFSKLKKQLPTVNNYSANKGALRLDFINPTLSLSKVPEPHKLLPGSKAQKRSGTIESGSSSSYTIRRQSAIPRST
jgi:hypothetical protein